LLHLVGDLFELRFSLFCILRSVDW